MKCAWCGYIRRKGDDHFVSTNECPSCGNPYDKNGDPVSIAFPIEADASEPVLRPSPVDVESLKKARERVEKRLQGRLSVHKRDSRHDQTLELARQFASEGVRKRQEQWKQQKASLQKSDDSRADSSSESLTAEDPSTSAPETTQEMTERAKVNDSGADTTASASDHKESYIAKALEKQQKSSIPNHSEQDAAHASADTSDILDMESESENSSRESWSVMSNEKMDEALSATAPDSEPAQEDDQPLTNGSHTASGEGHLRKRWRWVPGGNLTRLLPLVAWLILVSGILGAILSWTTLTDAEAGIQAQQMPVGNSMSLGLLLGFAYLVTGVLGFALFWVSSLISHQLKDIRSLLLLQPLHLNQRTVMEPEPAAEELLQ